ncbi:BMP family ABC transporter substrate-binding protein [Methylobacterium sp. SD274]|uniref:BMP family ABC transporter substrate-binding protein n=1 Tax=Methylobacterium sp. SD274 TaxID=2782009 RepID=UPI001A966A10|nr:BMP family ABC transporter substrate-binding protein [Methylobacterium sp. SD274]MBO1020389.1 BMP family ABC transporter substrate-binding protein [Methylobacterium sp. SD274]
MGMIKGVAVAVALTLGLGAAQAQEKPAGKLKVGFIYVGPVADFGYSFQHDQSRKALLAAMPDKVETSFLENVPEADSERSIESLARSGHQLIFTTSFGFMEPTLKVAKKFPKVKFEHATGYKRSANVSTYSARFYEGRYICGEIAGRLSKTGTVGYIASFPIPEVVSGINAFMLGAQSVNPNIKLKIVWVNTWFDPGKEAEAAKALLAQGADILSQHTDSAAPLQEAEKQGKFAFGQSSDQMRFAPKAQLTSIVDDWDGYVIGEAKAVLDGTWKSHDTWGGIKEGMVVLAPFANMPDDVKAKAEASKKAIADGTLHPFKGPVLKQDGSVAVKEGETAPDPMILGMNWYVKGIDDKLPN